MTRPDDATPAGSSRSRPGERGVDLDPAALVELATRFSRRERPAFEAVFRLYRGAVYAIGVLELGDAAEAEDLVQETFRRAWSAAASLDSPTKLRPWLFSISRNLCADARESRRRRPVELDALPDTRVRASRELSPLAAAVRSEKIHKIQHLLTTIPDQFRQILAMRLLEERSYQEISDLLGIPLHSVKNAIARGGRMLVDKIRNHPGLAPQDESGVGREEE